MYNVLISCHLGSVVVPPPGLHRSMLLSYDMISYVYTYTCIHAACAVSYNIFLMPCLRLTPRIYPTPPALLCAALLPLLYFDLFIYIWHCCCCCTAVVCFVAFLSPAANQAPPPPRPRGCCITAWYIPIPSSETTRLNVS